MSGPQIIMPEVGRHNADLAGARARLTKAQSYRDLGTVILCPTRGRLYPRVVSSWMALMRPMNQKCVGPIFLSGMEVGEAYNAGVRMVLDSPELSTWPYILTLEEDNIPPADGLLKLYESIEGYDAVGGLYWTKGPGGQPMIYGDPGVMPRNFVPQLPQPNAVQPCNGLGMGFTLFRTALFRRLPAPWFKTVQEVVPGQGARSFTQDLFFFNNACGEGARFASDNRVTVGHYDPTEDLVW